MEIAWRLRHFQRRWGKCADAFAGRRTADAVFRRRALAFLANLKISLFCKKAFFATLIICVFARKFS